MAAVVTVTVTRSPVDATDAPVVLNENRHAAWMTSIFWSLIAIEPRRGATAGLPLIEYAIGELPWPLSGLKAIQSTSDLAVHGHSRLMPMVNCPSVASASMSTDRVDSETAQTDDGARLVTTLVVEPPPQPVTKAAIAATANPRTGPIIRKGAEFIGWPALRQGRPFDDGSIE